MTIPGAGGITIRSWQRSRRFHKEYCKLEFDLACLVDEKLQDLVKSPMPSGLKFEKLQGYASPAIYTIHITGNYKASMEITGDRAWLRRVADHNDIDRAP